MSLLEEFRVEVEAFLIDRKVEAATFGRDVLKDPNFVFDLRAGRSPNLRTIERVREYMRERAAA